MSSSLAWMRLVSAVVSLIATAPVVYAQDYPTRPVRIIVQTAAGASIDVIARLVADHLTRSMGQQVLVVNQPGAGGVIAARAASTAAPDGYTLFMAASSVFVVLPEIQANLPFDVKDFVPIAFIAEQPMAIAVSAELGLNSLQDLIARTKAVSGGLNCAVATRGGLSHLSAEAFRSRSGADLTFVHYPGTAQALNDVIAGRVPMVMDSFSAMAGAVAGGQIKLLAIAASDRLAGMPDIPTVSETVPGFIATGWIALIGPPGTDALIVRKVSEEVRSALARPDLREKFEGLGSFTRTMTPAELGSFIREEQDLWRPIVRQVGLGSQR